MQVLYSDDTVRSGVRDPGSARPGIPCRQGRCALSGAGFERQDELRRFSGRAALAAHDKVDVAAPDSGPMVVPDVLVGVDMERGILVFAER